MKLSASQIQANSCRKVPATIAQILASAGLGAVTGKVSLLDLDRGLSAANVPTAKRLELKAWMHSAGLLVAGHRL
jgi:hypothetical protein